MMDAVNIIWKNTTVRGHTEKRRLMKLWDRKMKEWKILKQVDRISFTITSRLQWRKWYHLSVQVCKNSATGFASGLMERFKESATQIFMKIASEIAAKCGVNILDMEARLSFWNMDAWWGDKLWRCGISIWKRIHRRAGPIWKENMKKYIEKYLLLIDLSHLVRKETVFASFSWCCAGWCSMSFRCTTIF